MNIWLITEIYVKPDLLYLWPWYLLFRNIFSSVFMILLLVICCILALHGKTIYPLLQGAVPTTITESIINQSLFWVLLIFAWNWQSWWETTNQSWNAVNARNVPLEFIHLGSWRLHCYHFPDLNQLLLFTFTHWREELWFHHFYQKYCWHLHILSKLYPDILETTINRTVWKYSRTQIFFNICFHKSGVFS